MTKDWVQRNKERDPDRIKAIGDAIPFGIHKGTPVSEMNSDRKLKYLEWMLKTEHEDVWGQAIREQFSREGHLVKRGDDIPVIFDLEVIDRYSLIFGDLWLESVKASMTPMGLAKYMEVTAFRAFDAHAQGKVDGKAGREYTGEVIVEHGGVTWHFRDTGVSIKVLTVHDPEELVEIETSEAGDHHDDDFGIPF